MDRGPCALVGHALAVAPLDLAVLRLADVQDVVAAGPAGPHTAAGTPPESVATGAPPAPAPAPEPRAGRSVPGPAIDAVAAMAGVYPVVPAAAVDRVGLG